jgi:hypothetical protein
VCADAHAEVPEEAVHERAHEKQTRNIAADFSPVFGVASRANARGCLTSINCRPSPGR